jgi:dihydrofolate reductase
MKKLKLQVQMTVDGFVGGPKGQLDWMNWDWDDKIKNYVNELTDSIDNILLGRKMTEGFISYWTSVLTKPDDPAYAFAKKMIDTPKVVFSRTLDKSCWENTALAKGNLTDEVKKLKNQDGKDIIVYGGANFVSNLIKEGLIDEFYLFINPVAISSGLTIFGGINRINFLLVESVTFDCGIVLLRYKQK